LLGEQFLSLITFMGCSPFVRLEPDSPDDAGHCHLTLVGPLPEPILRQGQNSRPPLCGNCRKPIPEWRHYKPEDALKCPRCGTANPADRLDWKHNTGIARLFIEIHNIFPGEAIPTPKLINALGSLTSSEWDYFFLFQEDHHSSIATRKTV
jgi:hypothetical protein